MALKKDLIAELVEKWGHDESEIKSLTNAKLQKLIKQEEEDAQALQKEEKVEKSTRKKLDRNMLVTVMNGTVGRLVYHSKKTGQVWDFHDYGQTDEMELSELITIRNAHNGFLTNPWMIVLDDDVVEYLGLKDLYENILSPDQLTDLFDLSEDRIKEIIKKAPKGMIQPIVGMARRKYEEGSLTNIRVIRLIEETFNVELQDE